MVYASLNMLQYSMVFRSESMLLTPFCFTEYVIWLRRLCVSFREWYVYSELRSLQIELCSEILCAEPKSESRLLKLEVRYDVVYTKQRSFLRRRRL